MEVNGKRFPIIQDIEFGEQSNKKRKKHKNNNNNINNYNNSDNQNHKENEKQDEKDAQNEMSKENSNENNVNKNSMNANQINLHSIPVIIGNEKTYCCKKYQIFCDGENTNIAKRKLNKISMKEYLLHFLKFNPVMAELLCKDERFENAPMQALLKCQASVINTTINDNSNNDDNLSFKLVFTRKESNVDIDNFDEQNNDNNDSMNASMNMNNVNNNERDNKNRSVDDADDGDDVNVVVNGDNKNSDNYKKDKRHKNSNSNINVNINDNTNNGGVDDDYDHDRSPCATLVIVATHEGTSAQVIPGMWYSISNYEIKNINDIIQLPMSNVNLTKN